MIEYICEGCRKVTKDLKCGIFERPPELYIRLKCCPMNYMEQRPVAAKLKKRVGQQKTKRNRS